VSTHVFHMCFKFHGLLVMWCVCVCAGVRMYAFSYTIHMHCLLVHVRVHRCFMCVSYVLAATVCMHECVCYTREFHE